MAASSIPSQRIQANGTIARPLTMQIDFGKATSFERIADILEDKFTRNAIHCVVPFGPGRYQITFTATRHCNTAQEEGVSLDGRSFKMEPIDVRYVTVILRNCPVEMDPEDIRESLKIYGDMTRHEFEVLPGGRGWLRGTRKITMRMKSPIPNIIKIGVYTVVVTYPGVVLQCRRCKGNDHLISTCEAEYCHKCQGYGHTNKACPTAYKNRVQRESEEGGESKETQDQTEDPKVAKESTTEEDLASQLEMSSDEEEALEPVQKPAAIVVPTSTPRKEKPTAETETEAPSTAERSFADLAKVFETPKTQRTPRRKEAPETVQGDFSMVKPRLVLKKKKKTSESVKPVKLDFPADQSTERELVDNRLTKRGHSKEKKKETEPPKDGQ